MYKVLLLYILDHMICLINSFLQIHDIHKIHQMLLLLIPFYKANWPRTHIFNIDEYGDEQTLMTHHWIIINGRIYDFSKGTLRDYINWDDVYDVNVDGDEWRYN